jgi:acetyltransferase-like isoleucine patch superfamily enzyme
MWLIIDRIIEKFLRYYRKEVFLARINSKRHDVKVLGQVHVLATNVKIGNNVTIYPDVTFWGDGEIAIGDNVDIGNGTIIFSSKRGGGVNIDNNVAIAAHCYIIDSDHGMNMSDLIRNQELVSDKIYIGNDVWIAENCTILKGSVINDGAVIGAKSLVNNEIESYGIAVGVPAKVIKFRK